MPASYRAKTSKPTESSLAPAGPADGAAGPRAGRGAVADAVAIRDALAALLAPGQVVEIRALHATSAGDRREGVESGYFNDTTKAAAAVVGLRSARGVYWAINPVAPALLARASNRLRRAGSGDTTADHDVVRRRWVPVDLDPVRPSGISATDAEHAAALELARRISEDLANEGWPLPVRIDSGNGALLLYRVDLPSADAGLVAAVLAGLAARFSDDAVKVDTSVHNAARICRLPGTLNCKGDDAPDRPHRMAALLSVPHELEVVTPDQLRAIATLPELPAPAAKANGHANGRLRPGLNGTKLDVPEWVAKHHLDVGSPERFAHAGGIGTKWIFNVCPFNSDHTDGAAFVAAMQSGAGVFRCHHNGCSGKTWSDLRELIEGPRRAVDGRRQPGPSRSNGRPQELRPQESDVSGSGRANDPDDEFVNPKSDGGTAGSDVRPAPQIREAIDLLAAYPDQREAILHGLLRRGETMNLVGGPKSFKSQMVMALLIAAALGLQWLGTFKVEPGPVLLVDNELYGDTIAARLRRVADRLGVNPADLAGRFDVVTLRGDLRSVHGLEAFFRDIPEGRYQLIALDAIYRMLPDDEGAENSNSVWAGIYNAIDRHAMRIGCAFIIVHHTSKGAQGDKAITDVGAGAGAQSRAADCHMVIRRHEEDDAVVVEAEVRTFSKPAPLGLRLDYPLWVPDPTLDPTLLKRERGRGGRPRKEQPQTPSEAKKQLYTPDTFAAAFVTAEPTPAKLVVAKAMSTGMSKADAERLLLMAEHHRAVFKRMVAGDNKTHYATTEPALTDGVSVSRAPPTPPKGARR